MLLLLAVTLSLRCLLRGIHSFMVPKMFARCGLELEFDFSLPKTKKAKTDDYPPRERSTKVDAKRRDLQERIKADVTAKNRHHHQQLLLTSSGLSSPSQAGDYVKRNANTADDLATTRSVTQAEYDLFKENKRAERYALWEHGFHLPDPPISSPAPPLLNHMDIDNGNDSQYFHESPTGHDNNSSSESSPVLLSPKLSSHSPSSSRYCSHSSPSTPTSTISNNNRDHHHENHDKDDELQHPSAFVSTNNNKNENDNYDGALANAVDTVPSTLDNEHQNNSASYSYVEEEYYWEIDMRRYPPSPNPFPSPLIHPLLSIISTNKLFDSEPFTFAGVRFKMTFAPAYMQVSSHPDPNVVDKDDGGPMTRESGDHRDSYTNPKHRGSRTGLDVHQRTSRVVQGALCFSPVMRLKEEGAMAESSDQWMSTPSTIDVSTSSSSSSSHYSALTHPLTSNHSYSTNHFGRSASTTERRGQQLLTTPLLQSIPRGYSFLLSLAQGHPNNPRTQSKQVVVHCEFKLRGLLRPAFLRSAGNLIFSDTTSSHSHTSQESAGQGASASRNNCGVYRGFQTFMGPELLGFLEQGKITLSIAMRSHVYEDQLLGMADGSPITPPFLPLTVPKARVKRASKTHPIDVNSHLPTTSASTALAAATTLSTVATHQVIPSRRHRIVPQPTVDLLPNPTNSQTLPPLEDIYLQHDSPHDVFIAGNPTSAWGFHQHQHPQIIHPRTFGITDDQPKNKPITNPVDISDTAAAPVRVVTSSVYPSRTLNFARRRLAPRLITTTTTTHSL